MGKRKGKKLRIGVIMGGISSEREVSLNSGAAIIKELRANGENVIAIDLKERSMAKIEKADIDVAVIALHGTCGEDGAVQGMLDFLGIPYTGSDLLSSAIGMNKEKSKVIMAFHGIPTAPWKVMDKKSEINSLKLGYPVVFKEIRAGFSREIYKGS